MIRAKDEQGHGQQHIAPHVGVDQISLITDAAQEVRKDTFHARNKTKLNYTHTFQTFTIIQLFLIEYFM